VAKGLATEQQRATRISTIISTSMAAKVRGTMSAGTVVPPANQRRAAMCPRGPLPDSGFSASFAVFLPYIAERRPPICHKILISLASPRGFEPLLPP
jgi:hypothetical protein